MKVPTPPWNMLDVPGLIRSLEVMAALVEPRREDLARFEVPADEPERLRASVDDLCSGEGDPDEDGARIPERHQEDIRDVWALVEEVLEDAEPRTAQMQKWVLIRADAAWRTPGHAWHALRQLCFALEYWSPEDVGLWEDTVTDHVLLAHTLRGSFGWMEGEDLHIGRFWDAAFWARERVDELAAWGYLAYREDDPQLAAAFLRHRVPPMNPVHLAPKPRRPSAFDYRAKPPQPVQTLEAVQTLLERVAVEPGLASTPAADPGRLAALKALQQEVRARLAGEVSSPTEDEAAVAEDAAEQLSTLQFVIHGDHPGNLPLREGFCLDERVKRFSAQKRCLRTLLLIADRCLSAMDAYAPFLGPPERLAYSRGKLLELRQRLMHCDDAGDGSASLQVATRALAQCKDALILETWEVLRRNDPLLGRRLLELCQARTPPLLHLAAG